MSKAVDETAEPTLKLSGQGSSQLKDSAAALDGNVQSKHELIARACKENDFDNLVQLATSEGGLVNDELRRKACESMLLASSYLCTM